MSSGFVIQPLDKIAEAQADRFITNPRWWMQEKKDGHRYQIRSLLGSPTAWNKQGIQRDFPKGGKLFLAAQKIPVPFVFDGEWVAPEFFVFDVLHWHDMDLRNVPYCTRLTLLESLLGKNGLLEPILSSEPVLRVVHTARTEEEKRAEFARCQAERREGVVFKAPEAAVGSLAMGRLPWVKCKFLKQLSAIVIKHNEERSVELGLFDHGTLVEIGGCSIPTNKPVPGIGTVSEIEYNYAFPKSHHLFSPVYLRQRDDVSPHECTLSQLEYKG